MTDETLEKLINQYDTLVNRIHDVEDMLEIKNYRNLLMDKEEVGASIKSHTKNERNESYHGEYWDVIRTVRHTISYVPEEIRKLIPEFADGVIEETVIKSRINGLLKGGLISDDQISDAVVDTETLAVSIKRSSKLKV